MLITTAKVAQRLNVCRSTVERLRRNPKAEFPKPMRVGPNSVRYDADELEKWIESRKGSVEWGDGE